MPIFAKTHHAGGIVRNRKESLFYKQISLLDLDTGAEVITARFYGNTRIHCCLWVRQPTPGEAWPDGVNLTGGGWASGYGYHKESAALSSAIKDACISLPFDIAGAGDAACLAALLTIAKELGLKKTTTIKAHA
jgi:hypothetical protein